MSARQVATCCQCDAALTGNGVSRGWCDACQDALDRQRKAENHENKLRKQRADLRRAAEYALKQLPAYHRSTPLAGLIEKLHPKLRTALPRCTLDRSILVTGPSGAGKTTLAAAAIKQEAERSTSEDIDPLGVPVRLDQFRWTTAHRLTRARREHGLGQGDAPLIVEAVAAITLVIDEVGAEPASEVLFDVIDERYAAGRITLVTSGLTPEAFRGRYGDAMWRRLTEAGVGASIDLHGGTTK